MARVSVFAGIVGVGLFISLGQVQEAKACGLKLTIQAAKVKAILPSANPSRVLLVGNSPSNLDSSLQRAGHKVQTVKKVDQAKGADFNVIMVEDDAMVAQARESWPEAQVMTMSSSNRRNLAMVEQSMERAPKAAKESRVAVASSQDRVPVAAGPEVATTGGTPSREPAVAAGDGATATAPVAVAANTTPVARSAPEPIVREEQKPKDPEEEKVVVAKAEPVREEKSAKPAVTARESAASKPMPVAATSEDEEVAPSRGKEPAALVASRAATPRLTEERVKIAQNQFTFAPGSSALSSAAKKILNNHYRWLQQNPNATIALEGHADSTGSSDFNMALSARRAEAARDHLLSLGLAEGRISTVSHGEDKPVYEPGTDPRNRCVVLVRGSDG